MKLPDVLPQLTGRWLLAYRVLWSGLFLLALWSAVVGTWRIHQDNQAKTLAGYKIGLRGAPQRENQWRVAPTSAEARAAGLQFGDTLIGVDGKPVVGTLEASPAWGQMDGPDGTRVRLRLRAPTGVERDVLLTRSEGHVREADAAAPMPFTSRNLLYTVIIGLAQLTALLAATILYRRRPHDPVAALLSIGLVSLGARTALFLLGVQESVPLLFRGVSSLVLLGVGVGLAVFPDGRFVPRWTWLVVPILLLGNTLEWLRPGLLLSKLLSIALFAIIVASLVLRFRGSPPGVQRQQIKALVFGTCVSLLLTIANAVLVELIARTEDLPTFFWYALARTLTSSLSILALCLGLLVSLLRYRLYDADAVISRSAAYAGLTVAMVAIFAASEKMLELLGEQYFSASVGAASGALAAAIAAALFVPLHSRLVAWAERRFQRQLTELRTRLPLAVADLRESANLEQLAEEVLARVQAGVRAAHLAFVSIDAGAPVLVAARGDGSRATDVQAWLAQWQAPGNGDAAQIDRADGVFPLRLPLATGGAEPVGWLLLGPRPDGSFFSADELNVLREIEEPLARAVAIVRRNEAWKNALGERLAAMEAVLARLVPAAGGLR